MPTCRVICRAPRVPQDGLNCQKDEIESGRHQWSEPPSINCFAEHLLTQQTETDPLQPPTKHSGAARGPYSPKPQNRFRSAPKGPPTRLCALCWLGTAVLEGSRHTSAFVRPHRRHNAASFAKKTKSSLVCPDGASRPPPYALLIRHTCVEWSRTRRKRPPCTAAPHDGLIRRNRKVSSGPRQRSQPPESWPLAGSAWFSRI